tara:strand:+ start:2301 stop:2549 length:249 start_codon:yes stop_codon:yes gene_type:complete
MSIPAERMLFLENKVIEIRDTIDNYFGKTVMTESYINGFVNTVTKDAFKLAKVSEEDNISHSIFRTQILKEFALKIVNEIQE